MPLQTWGHKSLRNDGFAGCCNPADFTLLGDGFVVTSEKGISRVKKYTTGGFFLGFVATPEAFVKKGVPADCTTGGEHDVAADSKGRILVLDTCDMAVRIFELKEDIR